MRETRGQTLIEFIVFIVVIGIVMTGIIASFNTVLLYSVQPGRTLVASLLADARMNLITQSRHLASFKNMTDPCSSGSLAACAGLKTFADNAGYVVSSAFSSGNSSSTNFLTATVSVTGTGRATNIVRFVESKNNQGQGK